MAQNNASRTSPRGLFRDRAVLVTGASSGIGQDVALAFASRGAQVALLARRKALLQETADRIIGEGGQAMVLPCDVTRRAEVQEAVAQAVRAYGQIDILINSAGILVPSKVEEMLPEDLERMMAVNLYGTLNTIQAVLPSMREAKRGSIVNIASLAGRRGLSPLGGYSATKFAVVGMTEALRMELFGSGINVTLVMPGIIDTPMETEARSSELLKAYPRIFSMPPRWVTWAVLAGVTLGLREVDVPLGAAVVEKMAALFPGVSDAFLSLGSRLITAAGRQFESDQTGKSARKEPEKPTIRTRGGRESAS